MRRLALLFGLLLPAALPAQDGADALRIHFLDVGQGDAILIEAPTGQRALIDAGPGSRVVDNLRRLGVDGLDLFVASHNHADHIGGAAAVVQAMPVRFFMDNGVPHTTVTYRNMLEALRQRDVQLLEPERRTINLGDVELEILPPSGNPALDHNNNSIGIALKYGEFRAMFGGDAENLLWAHWLATIPDAVPEDVEVHKASHHGSRNGDLRSAIARLSPDVVVISASAGNSYGHPHAEAVALYRSVGADVMVTAEVGTVTVAARPDGTFQITTDRTSPATAQRAPPATRATPSTSASAVRPAGACVDINRAGLDDLRRIIHIDVVRGREIIQLRAVRPFQSVSDLQRVRGIAAARIRDIQAQGLACVR